MIDTAHGAPSAVDADAVTAALDDVAGSEDVVYFDLAGIVDAVANTGMMDRELRGTSTRSARSSLGLRPIPTTNTHGSCWVG